ncbi:MAG: dihydropteroate synthase [Nitrosopumilus sp.]|nr:dihydropteroate synthase [Nitrosopumilus sp.]
MLTKIGNISIGYNFCPRVMGIINLSPESFYKKSIKLNSDEIQNAVLNMQCSGADIIDIGGMSTAPYLKTFIPVDLEIERLQYAVSVIRQITDIPISIDTVRSAVLAALLKYEINAINDVTGLKYDKQMPLVISESKIPVIIGAYKNNSTNTSNFIIGDIYDTINLLVESLNITKSSKIDDDKIIIDPSIGFFRKSGSNPFVSKIEGIDWYIRDINVLSNIASMTSLNKPICISVSGKSFMGSLLDLNLDERLIPSLITEIHCILNGVSLIRTHNVKETKLAINMIKILH